MAVNHDLKCSADCGAPMQEERVERMDDGVLYKVPFGEDPVRAVCDKCGADLQVVLTTFAIGRSAVAASRPDDHDFQPFAHARARHFDDETGAMTELGRVVFSGDNHGCLAVTGGSEVTSLLNRTATPDEPTDRSNFN